MLKKTTKIDLKGNIVYLMDKECQPTGDNMQTDLVEFAKEFLASDDEETFVKMGNKFTFFVKNNEDLEVLRVAGHSIRKKLDRTADNLTICGDGKGALALAEGLALSNYQFLKYFTDKQDRKYTLSTIGIYGDATEEEITFLNNTTKAVCWARDMVNEPVCYLSAEKLAEEAQRLGKEAGFDVKVFGKAEIEKLKMGGLLAVNRGSIAPPTFSILEYKPANPINKKPVVLVGKGIVFDTGGLSLKPTAGSMDSMKSDMGGAACMIGSIYAAALNKQNVHIIGLIPATDNRPGQNAYTPGDVVTMFDGTTIEVLNTDAEGRMILADAIAFANRYEPEVIIDAATLTGAALMVAGDKASCVMGNASQEVMFSLIQSGLNVHERLVLLPFWDDYKKQLKSTIADMKNIGGRNAGTITAGKFLEHFAKFPYIHIDIAGPAFTESEQDYKGVGGTGTGVRTLTDFFKHYKK